MKKTTHKLWGVVLAVALVAALFVDIPDASADAQSFSYAALPSDPTAVTAPGVEIYDFAVAATNELVIYAATSANALKSNDQGRTWTKIYTGPAGSDATGELVVVAPDNANVVAYASNVDLHVRVSLDGGISFYDIGIPSDTAGNPTVRIYDIDISREFTDAYGNTYRYVGIAGTDSVAGPGNAAFYFYKVGAYVAAQWKDAVVDFPSSPAGYTDNDACFFAVKFSPTFQIDSIVYLLSQDSTGPIELHVCSLNVDVYFDASISIFLWYDQAATGGTYVIQNPVAPVAKGQIIFDPEYSAAYYGLFSRKAYCSVATTAANNGGAFSISENESGQPGIGASVSNTSIWSIALSEDGSILLAAASHDNTVYGGDGVAVKRIGGGTTALGGVTTTTDNMTIAYAGPWVLCAKASDMGAFAISTDDGATFNDISLINTTLENINDQVIEATTGNEHYIVSSGHSVIGGVALTDHTSVWYWDGEYWERIFVRADTDQYIIRASPENFGVVYMGDTSNSLIYYTETHGKADWRWRTVPPPASTLVDMEVVDNASLYIAVNNGGTGYVCLLSYTGLYWNAIPVFGSGTAIASITLVSADEVIAGSQTGQVAYTATGGNTPSEWTLIAPGIIGTNVYTDAVSLTPGDIVYAVSSTGPATLWAYTIGSDASEWTDVYTSGLGGVSPHSLDVIILGEGVAQCIYYLSGDGAGAAANIELARSFTADAFDGGWGAVQGIYEGGQYPNALQGSADAYGNSGNQIWFIDTYGSNRWPTSMKGWGEIPAIYPQIIAFTDVLAAYVVPPALTSPIDKYIIQVNGETGIAYDVSLQWTQSVTGLPSLYTYQLQIALDSNFTTVVIDVNGATSPTVIGPWAGSPFTLVYQPGEIYYWRIRVTAPFVSAWSEYRELDVQAIAYPAPDLYVPANGGTVNSNTVSFSWSPMSGTAVSSAITTTYTVWVGTDPDFATGTYAAYNVTDTTSMALTLADGRYYWRVCTQIDPHTNWSMTAWFDVDTAPPVTETETLVVPTSANSVTVQSDNVTIERDSFVFIWAIIIIGVVMVIIIIVLIFVKGKRR